MQLTINISRQLLLFTLLVFGVFKQAESQVYFQQEVNYKINVSLNDRDHELSAFESIEYINNSPDTLQFLYFHLWPNGYSDNRTDLAKQLFSTKGKSRLFKDPALKGYIDSLDFKVNDSQVRWELSPGQPDICKVVLNQPLLSGDTISISTPFHVKIPKGVTSRLGHIGESYQISQWYPKPAVYDRSGWNQMPYLDQGEFYSEFGSFDVSITLPENYIVGATGNLQNVQEAEMLDKLATDTTIVRLKKGKKPTFPQSSEKLKTLQYKEKNIHDFAWFADKRFHVRKGSVKLPQSGREVTTWVMFTDQQGDLWKNSIPYVNSAVKYFSGLIGDYPYSTVTAVQSALAAGSGMEYPGITVIGLVKSAYGLDQVIAHEIAHNWFYGALASNERRYPFMDEGMTSAYEERYLDLSYPGKKLWEVYLKNKKLAKFLHVEKMPVVRMLELEWLAISRRSLEQPLNLTSADYSEMNYATLIYDKGAMVYKYLRSYLGDSLFDAAMQDYYQFWKFRHPQPDDLRNVFISHTTKDLTWFFDDLLGTTKRLDYKITGLKDRQLELVNKGEMVSPVVISGLKGDSVCFEKWYDGFKGKTSFTIPAGDYSQIKIDPLHRMPELYRLNNNIRTSGLFRKIDPVLTQFYFTVEDPEKRTIMWIPSINWNSENGFMVGVTLHNGFLVPKPFEYFLMPFYSIHNADLAGFGKIAFNITPCDKFYRLATISLDGTQYRAPAFQNYHNLRLGLQLNLKENKINPDLKQKIYGYYILATDLNKAINTEQAKMLAYIQFGYLFEKTSVINPWQFSTLFEAGKTFQKTSVEFNYRYSYFGKKSGMNLRLFAGTMLKSSKDVPFYNLSAGGRSGREIYLYQGTYPNRFGEFPKTIGSRQMSLSEGGIASPVNAALGYSKWLFSMSLSSNLPGIAGRIPVKPFVNLLLNDHGLDAGHPSKLFFEAGIKAGIWNLLEIYLPLVVSDNIGSLSGTVKERIRFVLTLDLLSRYRLNTSNVK